MILLDEPFAAIDAATVQDLAAIVRGWNAEGRTVISVTHDLQHVRQEYPEVLLLAREIVARGTPAEVLSAENLERARRLAAQHDEHGHAEHAVCHAGEAPAPAAQENQS